MKTHELTAVNPSILAIRQSFKTIIIFGTLFILLLIFAAGCDENGGITIPSGATELTLSMKSDDILDNITITEAKALITEVQYERESGRNQLHHTGPFVINFSLSGSLKELLTGYIVRDKYTKVKFQVHKPEDNETVSDPEFKEGTGENQRYSFIIKGVYNGASFIYKTKKSMNLVISMNKVINVNLKKQNITVALNETGWFKNGSVELNPNDPNNANMIDENIKNSFKTSFLDDNKDGIPDDN
jgi:hypothetical protein